MTLDFQAAPTSVFRYLVHATQYTADECSRYVAEMVTLKLAQTLCIELALSYDRRKKPLLPDLTRMLAEERPLPDEVART